MKSRSLLMYATMTPSPVVGPDRDGGRAVETNVGHKIGDDARVRVGDAAGSVDGKARNHGDSPALSRFAVQCDANMRLAHMETGSTMSSEIFLKSAGKGTRSRD